MRYHHLKPYLAPAALLVTMWGCSPSSPGSSQPAGEGPRPEQNTDGAKRRGAVVYGPISQGRYRLDSRDSIAMEMPDGSFQRTVTVKASFLTLTLRPRGSDFAAEISLDSMILDRPNSMLQPLVDSAWGTRWQGIVRKTGRLDSLTASKPTVFGEQVRAMLQRLLPIVPDSGAEPGDRWQDRTTMPYQIMAGFEATEDRVADFRAGKWEDEGGRRVLVIQSTMNYTVTGSGSGFGQEIRFEGGGAAEGTHRLAASGILVQAQVTDSVRMTLTVPAIGQSVPAVVVTSYSLSTQP
jgi:hypothetical protein